MPPYASDAHRFDTFLLIVAPFLRRFIICVRDAHVRFDLPTRRFLAQQPGNIHRLLNLNLDLKAVQQKLWSSTREDTPASNAPYRVDHASLHQ